MRLNEFNHEELACDVARDFRVAYRDVEALYGRGVTRQIPLFGVGHSLGAKVHVLLNCYPEVTEVAKRRKVRVVRHLALRLELFRVTDIELSMPSLPCELPCPGVTRCFFTPPPYVIYGKIVMSAQMLEVSLLGVETVLRLERDTCSMVK